MARVNVKAVGFIIMAAAFNNPPTSQINLFVFPSSRSAFHNKIKKAEKLTKRRSVSILTMVPHISQVGLIHNKQGKRTSHALSPHRFQPAKAINTPQPK